MDPGRGCPRRGRAAEHAGLLGSGGGVGVVRCALCGARSAVQGEMMMSARSGCRQRGLSLGWRSSVSGGGLHHTPSANTHHTPRLGGAWRCPSIHHCTRPTRKNGHHDPSHGQRNNAPSLIPSQLHAHHDIARTPMPPQQQDELLPSIMADDGVRVPISRRLCACAVLCSSD